MDAALIKSSKERGISKNDLAMEILASWERKMPPGELAGDVIRKAVAKVVTMSMFHQIPWTSPLREEVGLVHKAERVTGGGGEGVDAAQESVDEAVREADRVSTG